VVVGPMAQFGDKLKTMNVGAVQQRSAP